MLFVGAGECRVQYISDERVAVLFVNGDDVHRPGPHEVEGS